jgi:catechol 2,3-dioxygenase-like lactoylglutathione lyase family enzyme
VMELLSVGTRADCPDLRVTQRSVGAASPRRRRLGERLSRTFNTVCNPEHDPAAMGPRRMFYASHRCAPTSDHHRRRCAVFSPVSARDGCRCWHALNMIGRLEKTVIDCPEPRALAEFYCQVLGMRVNEDIDDWVVIGLEPGLRQLGFQRVTQWIAPRWPDPTYPQQLHLDIRVSDADQAERELLALGATRAPGERETGFRVFTDPVGHPFCIVFGQHHQA